MIATVTLNPNVDVSCRCRHVSPDCKIRCHDSRRDPGGGGINVCRIIRELGGECFAVWLSGGESGAALSRLLDEAGVSGSAVEMRGPVRHNLYVSESSSDREFRFVLPGPQVGDEEIDAVGDRIERLDGLEVLVLSGSLPPGVDPDCYARLAGRVSAARTVVDTSGEALQRTVEAGSFLIKPNLRELSQLAGRDELDSEGKIADAAGRVVDEGGASYVLVSLGAGGAVCVSDDRRIRLHPPVVKVRSTVGAGDSMVAGTVLGFSQGRSAADAARLGVAAGTAAVTTPGTTLCRRRRVEELYDQIDVTETERTKVHHGRPK